VRITMSKRGEGSKPTKGTSSATLRTKHEKSLQSKQATKKAVDKRKFTAMKDGVDINMDVQRAKEVNIETGLSNEIAVAERRAPSHAPLTAVAPQRNNQTMRTLAQSNRVDDNDADSGAPLHMELVRANELLYERRNNGEFPLEWLITMGMLSTQTPTIESRQYALAAQYGDSVSFMRDMLKQLCRIPTPINMSSPLVATAPSSSSPTTTPPTPKSGKNTITVNHEVQRISGKKRVKKTDGDGENDDSAAGPLASSVKVSHIIAPMNFTCTYMRQASNDYKKHIFPIYDREKERITHAFFTDDSLEDNVPPGTLPWQFKIFQQLAAQHAAKYEQRDSAMANFSVDHSAHPVVEVIARSHIQRYRYRPRPKDQLCFNGTRCYFYTYSSDPSVRYVGKVFRTPLQEEAGHADGCPVGNLCIDCILAGWTQRQADNFVKERSPSLPANHFTVMVGKGEYSEACMLHQVFNKLVTGFTGNVPYYHSNHRAIDYVTLRHVGESAAVKESYVAEIGTDF
jgi:hypothetical protein